MNMAGKPQRHGQMGDLVTLDRSGPVAVLTLNRPHRHNSLVPGLLRQLLAALEEIASDRTVGAAVVQANGRSFSTGGDLAEFRAHLDDLEGYASLLVGLLNRVIVSLVRLPVPVVAAVHGLVTGGSLGLVLGSDVVLLAPEASFVPYYGVVGFSPDGGWTALMPAIVGVSRTTEVLLRNLAVSAEQAVDWGLASRIVPADRIRDDALASAQDIAGKKPGSIRHTKRLLGGVLGDLEARLESERARFVQQIATDEARQGIVEFLSRPGKPAASQSARR